MNHTLGLLTALALASVAVAAPSVASGKGIYTANCAGCHGAKAQGSVGPNLHEAAGWTAALFNRALLQSKDDKGVALKPPMPNWSKGFAPHVGRAPTKDEMASIQRYIRTLK
jgi:mono/diheme cytochrome c family protein